MCVFIFVHADIHVCTQADARVCVRACFCAPHSRVLVCERVSGCGTKTETFLFPFKVSLCQRPQRQNSLQLQYPTENSRSFFFFPPPRRTASFFICFCSKSLLRSCGRSVDNHGTQTDRGFTQPHVRTQILCRFTGDNADDAWVYLKNWICRMLRLWNMTLLDHKRVNS